MSYLKRLKYILKKTATLEITLKKICRQKTDKKRLKKR
jgi:hypothetical protein